MVCTQGHGGKVVGRIDLEPDGMLSAHKTSSTCTTFLHGSAQAIPLIEDAHTHAPNPVGQASRQGYMCRYRQRYTRREGGK